MCGLNESVNGVSSIGVDCGKIAYSNIMGFGGIMGDIF